MNRRITRRQALRCGAAAVGWTSAQALLPPFAAHDVQAATTPAPSLPVAIGRCASYEPNVIFAKLKETVALLGGMDRFARDKTVTVKLNLTGGPQWKLGGLPSYRTYHVHPQFVAAACAAFHEAGARRIVLVESGYARESLEEVMTAGGWDLDSIQRAGGGKVVWEDTRNQGRWPNYSRLRVPWGGYLYPAFDLNSRYEKTDVFVSLAKLKDHANAGVTLRSRTCSGSHPRRSTATTTTGRASLRSMRPASPPAGIHFTAAFASRRRESRRKSIRSLRGIGATACRGPRPTCSAPVPSICVWWMASKRIEAARDLGSRESNRSSRI